MDAQVITRPQFKEETAAFLAEDRNAGTPHRPRHADRRSCQRP